MSYKKIWNLLNTINTKALQLISGKNGGKAKVINYGLVLIAKFQRLNQKCMQYLNVQFKAMNILSSKTILIFSFFVVIIVFTYINLMLTSVISYVAVVTLYSK